MTPSLSTTRLRARLLRHHLPLAVGASGSVAGLAALIGEGTGVFRLSMATAYVGLALLAATLAIGPVYALLGRRVPTSFDLRRDVGIWAGTLALAHTAVGAFVHLGNPLLYVFRADLYPARLVLRADPFGAANYAGLLAAALAAVLLATSNDAAVKRLTARRWKRVQRLSYALFGLVVAHGAAYQWIESRPVRYVLVFAGLVGIAGGVQALGVARRRRGQRPRPSPSARPPRLDPPP